MLVAIIVSYRVTNGLHGWAGPCLVILYAVVFPLISLGESVGALVLGLLVKL